MAENKAFQRDEISKIINSVLEKINQSNGGTALPYESLGQELLELTKTIETLRQQLSSSQAEDISKTHIPSAADELDAVVSTTEQATETIMESCETILEIAKEKSPDAFPAIEEHIIKIFEACTFQDLTGQRIQKVNESLKDIETKANAILNVIQGKYDQDSLQKAQGDELLNGPALPQDSVSQEEIDKLLSELDL